MREILFHGKRVDNGEWVEGDLLQTRYHSGHIEYQIMLQTPVSSAYPVLPETVGQYTGLTDKNGKRIFEGDILNTSNSNCRIWYVDYKHTAFCVNQVNANYCCLLDEFMQYSSVEVISNIHDNPELLVEEGE